METFDRTAERTRLAGPGALYVEISEAVRRGYPEFEPVLELSHLPLLDKQTCGALVAAREHLVHAHIGNCVPDDPGRPAYGAQHRRFDVAGAANDALKVLDCLRVPFEIGVLGDAAHRPFLAFGVKPFPGDDPAAVIAATRRVFTEARAQL